MPDTSAFVIPHSPIAALGSVALLAAFLVAAYGAAAGIYGNYRGKARLIRSSVLALYSLCAIMMLASALIIYAFVSHDFSIKYVALYSDTSMPLFYKITSYWGGLDGSLMFWVSVLAVFSTIAVAMNRRRHADMIGYVAGTIFLIQLFFLALLIYNKNPFATWLTEPPIDGKGLNPLLQTYWMAIHPPSLYIGFVSAAIPFSFGIAALASGRLDDQWLSSVRVWTLTCWFFLTFGLILGGRWAYEELGWGGYWAWDPVENAGLLPWFTATAFLHSVIIQEQRGMLKVWNMILVITTFFLTIWGTFMTRSGIVQSVHAFGEDPELALLFVLFMAVVLLVSIGLVIYRLPRLGTTTYFESFLSREFAFLLNNWILLGCAVFVLFATMYPTISEAVSGQRITVGAPFFNRWMIPFGLVLLFLAGAAPLLAWRKTSKKRLWGQFSFPIAFSVLVAGGLALFVPATRVRTQLFVAADKLEPGSWLLAEVPLLGPLYELANWPITLINFAICAFVFGSISQEFYGGARVRRKQTGSDPVTALIGVVLAKRRKFGGYIIHMAVAVMFIGFAGKAFEAEEHYTMVPGNSYDIRGYSLDYHRLIRDDSDSEHVVKAIAHVTLRRGDEVLTELYPEKRDYRKSEQPTSEVAVYSMAKEDVYLVLNGFEGEDKVTSFTVFVNPLINWVWIGFGILALGTALCLLKDSWVERWSKPNAVGSLGKTTGLVLLVAGSLLLTTSTTVWAQPAEHDEGGHQVGVTAAHVNREDDAAFLAQFRARAEEQVIKSGLTRGTPEFDKAVADQLAPVSAIAHRLFEDLVCLCGGCSRESLGQCRCSFAAKERGEVLATLIDHDLLAEEGRDRGYRAARLAMIAKYEAKEKGSGQRVLMIPDSQGFVWFPYLAVMGGFVLLFVVGRRWVRLSSVMKKNPNLGDLGEQTSEDQDYADILDDELRDID